MKYNKITSVNKSVNKYVIAEGILLAGYLFQDTLTYAFIDLEASLLYQMGDFSMSLTVYRSEYRK